MACNTHLLNTDSVRLHFPLAGEMFDPVVPNLIMRPGYLNLDIFCPVCGAFPFWPDGRKSGFRGVGRNLKTRGPDGKPKVVSVEQILGAAMVVNLVDHEAMDVLRSDQSGKNSPLEPIEPPWPCQECGAKSRLHKKVCSKFVPPRGKLMSGEAVAKPKTQEVAASPQSPPDQVPEWIVARVETVDSVPPDAPPTEREISEVAMERERRAMFEKNTNSLRPIQEGA